MLCMTFSFFTHLLYRYVGVRTIIIEINICKYYLPPYLLLRDDNA
jgi:hypothetical protein